MVAEEEEEEKEDEKEGEESGDVKGVDLHDGKHLWGNAGFVDGGEANGNTLLRMG